MGARKLSYHFPFLRDYKESNSVNAGLPNRHEAGNEYHYSLQEQEKYDEIKGIEGSNLDFGARIYDCRVGRWLSVDPLEAKYPYLNPYNFVANSPLMYINPDGKKIEMRTGVSGATNTNKGELREDLLKKIKNDKNQN